jgi:NDP-sugar pyrophosphorylase family protein
MILPPALVLTAGLGTRLRPLTYARAKAAVPVNGETLARRAVRWLAAQGVTDLVLNLHHLPETVAGSVGDGSDLGVHVRYSWENPVLGSAGGPRHALPLLTDSNREPQPKREPSFGGAQDGPECLEGPRTAYRDTFFIINGDTLTDAALASVLARHVESGARVTMALTPNPRPEKYGGVLISDDGYVTGFVRAGRGAPSFHFIGVQVAHAEVFTPLPDGVPWESVNTLYPQLIAGNPKSVAAFLCTASFRDIGTPADYLATCLVSPRGTRIDATARVARSAVWDDVTIGAGAAVTECIVCDRVTVPAGAAYRRVAIVRDPVVPGGDLIVRPLD